MHPLIASLAPLALLVPALGSSLAPPVQDLHPRPDPAAVPDEATQRIDLAEDPVFEQVRIEQRIVVRIAPPGPAVRQSFAAEMVTTAPQRLAERKMGNCVPVSGIAAVQPDAGDKLLLYMRDRRLISASLEKSCSARDFYSGFYVERTSDGMLCVERDRLHSRAGSNCEISRMRQLVVDED